MKRRRSNPDIARNAKIAKIAEIVMPRAENFAAIRGLQRLAETSS